MEERGRTQQEIINEFIIDEFDIVTPSSNFNEITMVIHFFTENIMEDEHLLMYPAIYIQ
jgi:hypothetical protein